MTLYLDTSALLKRYLDEPDSGYIAHVLSSDPVWVTRSITGVEAWRNIGRALDGGARGAARAGLSDDWRRVRVVEIDGHLCRDAGRVAR